MIAIIELALREDFGKHGDVTSDCVAGVGKPGAATIISRQPGALCGLGVAELVFKSVSAELSISSQYRDGDSVAAGCAVMKIQGRIQDILKAERTALNFLQRLSGVATMTRKFVDAISGTKAKILDTRKTTPGLRQLEKQAVLAGGGMNHRFGLYDMVLLKENHVAAAGGLAEATRSVRKSLVSKGLQLKVEVEVTNLSQVKEALALDIDRLMLDNMDLQEIRRAVALIDGCMETEVSGGVTLQTVRQIAETGVDFISVGALTHSAPAFDFSLLLENHV